MRRIAKWISLGTLGLAVAILALAAVAALSKGWSTEAAFRKVKVGMTPEEVSEAVGDKDPIFLGGSVHWLNIYQEEPRFWGATHSLTVEFSDYPPVAKSVNIDGPL